ncbi:hypothetical protein [Thalassobaculum litoreum]|uniref:RecT family protein n=1 Tax=Thalassobaculum litoreum DSM 18839 TaxID=1123362 RepID=A0A8G2BIJ1_9PROT|nr:hypothetical protein [Thalassobaculum litoreum]SDF82563.1 hypothetical protein SAMN05660686_02425 [Thalassobaculum litoreum DSM 18839]
MSQPTDTTATAVTIHEPAPAAQPQRMPAPLATGGRIAPVIPQDLDQAWRMAQLICRSNLAPKDMKTEEQIVTAIFHGLEVGLPPMQAVQSIAVVNGRPLVWGDAAKALVLASGLAEEITETWDGEGEKLRAICRVKRRGESAVHEQTFSVADAREAGLIDKDIWKKYRRRMLQMRARAFALRDKFPDVLKGLAVREEVEDYAEPVREASASTTAADLALPPASQQTTAAALTQAPAQAEAPGPEAKQEQPAPSAAAAPAENLFPGDQPAEKPAETKPAAKKADQANDQQAASPQDSPLHVKIPVDDSTGAADYGAYAMALRAVFSTGGKDAAGRAEFLRANPAIERLAFAEDVPAEERKVIAGIRADAKKEPAQ